MLRDRILLIYFFILFFIGRNVTHSLGVPNMVIFILLSILFVAIFIVSPCQTNPSDKNKYLCLFILYTANTVYKYLFDRTIFPMTATMMIIPMSLLVFPDWSFSKINLYRKLFKLLIVFYVLECGIAIGEVLFHNHVFGLDQLEESSIDSVRIDTKGFRSYSLHGHPLQNALIVATIMSNVLVSSFKPVYKYSLWMLGFIAILGFNTRSSILGSSAVLVCYTIWQLLYDKSIARYKYQILFLLTIALIVGFILLMSGNFGGRLLEMGVIDNSSAAVRIDVWRIFDFYALSDFLFGMTYDNYSYLLTSLGLYATENFWIDWVLLYGICYLLFNVILLGVIIFRLFRCYSGVQKTVVIGSFILLASTNNSLSTGYLPLIFFFVCAKLFSPMSIKFSVDKKFLL